MEQTALALPDRPPPVGIEPVDVEIVGRCEFRAKPCKLCGKQRSAKVHTPKRTATCPFKRQNGCATCGKAKGDADHKGSPPSMNIFAGTDPNTYRQMIEDWKALVLDRLRAAGLPPGPFASVLVEGEATFPRHARRDQGNHRVLIEKAVGDALVEGGWLVDDTWEHYEFGGLSQRVEPGVSRTRLLIMPRA